MATIIPVPAWECDLCLNHATARILREDGRTHGDYCHEHIESVYADVAAKEAAERTLVAIRQPDAPAQATAAVRGRE
jgi:hypothetical protein